MKIEDSAVVSMHYRLTNNEGELIDESKDSPLAFIYGQGQIIPGLENALTGKSVGDKVAVKISPEDAYGDYQQAMVQKVPRDQLAGIPDLKVGMQLEAQTDTQKILVTVTEVGDSEVTIDANHPLAGVELNFDVEIVNVRQATAEEIQHGHVHGPEGHQH
jgi:FKBP-type peptidyl-prolyl cis-trans isomerase SlyD